jgi:hypothetical protein
MNFGGGLMTLFDLLMPTGYEIHQQVSHSTTVRSAHTVFMCFIYLRKNSDFSPIHHKLIGFYNGEENCLLCSTDWVFKKQPALRL